MKCSSQKLTEAGAKKLRMKWLRQEARRVAWNEFGKGRVWRAVKLLLISTTSGLGVPGEMILKRIYRRYVETVTFKGMQRALRGLRKTGPTSVSSFYEKVGLTANSPKNGGGRKNDSH